MQRSRPAWARGSTPWPRLTRRCRSRRRGEREAARLRGRRRRDSLQHRQSIGPRPCASPLPSSPWVRVRSSCGGFGSSRPVCHHRDDPNHTPTHRLPVRLRVCYGPPCIKLLLPASTRGDFPARSGDGVRYGRCQDAFQSDSAHRILSGVDPAICSRCVCSVTGCSRQRHHAFRFASSHVSRSVFRFCRHEHD